MIRFIITTVLLGTMLTSFAQIPKVTWGPEYNLSGKWVDLELLGTDGTYFYAKDGKNFLAFDLNCRLISTQELDGINAGSKIEMLGGKRYLISAKVSKKENTVSFQYNEIRGAKLGEGINFHSHGCVDNTPNMTLVLAAEDITDFGHYQISQNGEFIVVASTDITFNENELIKLTVFDKEYKQLWQKSFTLPIADRNVSVDEMMVTNTGEVYIATRYWMEKSKNSYSRAHKIVALNNNGMKEYAIILDGDKMPHELKFFPVDEGVTIGGLFESTSSKNVDVIGVFFSKIDKSGVLSSKSYPFTSKFLEGLWEKDRAENGLSGAYDIKEMLILPDGNFTFVAEMAYDYIEQGRYYSNQLVIPHFSATGELLSMDKVLKKLMVGDQYQKSYALLQRNQELTFVYNATQKKEVIDAREKVKGNVGLALHTDVTTISTKGEVKTEALYASNYRVEKFSFFTYLDLGDGKLIILYSTKNKYSFGLLTLN